MPVSKRKQLRRVKKKFIRFEFMLQNGNKSKYYHQGLADSTKSMIDYMCSLGKPVYIFNY